MQTPTWTLEKSMVWTPGQPLLGEVHAVAARCPRWPPSPRPSPALSAPPAAPLQRATTPSQT